MKIHGIITEFPREIKMLILAFVLVLGVGYSIGLKFVFETTSLKSSEIETHYLGNENDENAEIMKFKKNEKQILTVIHNHIISMSIIFFLVSLILSTTSINKKLKYFLMIEPFISILLTFGGIYLLWIGILWFKYIIVLSGFLMTFCFISALFTIIYQILFSKKQ